MKPHNFKSQFSQGFKDLFSIWKDEITLVFKDSGVLIFFLVVPLLYPAAYTFIYNNEVARKVHMVAVDLDHTQRSREYLRKLDATPDVKIIQHCPDLKSAQIVLKKRKAYGVIYIPREFQKNIMIHKTAEVSVYSDMGVILNYKAITQATNAVALSMGRDIRAAAQGKWNQEAGEISATPVENENVYFFNPTSGFASYLMPAVLILIIQQTLVLGIGLHAGTQREKNAFASLAPIQKRYNGVMRIVFGQALAYFMVYALMCFWVLVAIPDLFHLNQLMDVHTFFAFLLPYLLACIAFGMTVSIFIRERETVMILFVFASVPLLFLSGISWPGFAIPPFWHFVSYLFPSTFGVNAFAKMEHMNASLQDISFEYQALWIQSGFYFITAALVTFIDIKASRKKIIAVKKEELLRERITKKGLSAE